MTATASAGARGSMEFSSPLVANGSSIVWKGTTSDTRVSFSGDENHLKQRIRQ